MNKITILGSGTSTGVPILGCNCIVCKSTDRRNKRLRSSVLLETQHSKTILVDAPPDLRTQLLRQKTQKLDAVIITHDHADHTHGMDDLRPFTFNRHEDLPVFTNQETCDSLKNKFPYIFQREKVFGDKKILGGGIPLLSLQTITPGKTQIMGEDFIFHSLPHGHGETLCFQHQKMGYVTDCREIPEDILKSFRNAELEVLVIDCLRYEPHTTHLHFDLTLQYIEAMTPKLAVLTHMSHDLDYLELNDRLISRGIKTIIPGIDEMCFFYS